MQKDIDLIILDVQMPDMDGFEVAGILKSNKRSREIPIIFASAEKKGHQFMLKGLEEGAIDYLYKPLDAQITEAKVNVLLQLHLQKKALARQNAELERYGLLINNSADLICIIHPRTMDVEEMNDASLPMLGYTPAEMKGHSLLSFLNEEDGDMVQQHGRQTDTKFSFETLAYSKDGTGKWLHWNIVHKNERWFANARDITQQKQAEREIQQLNEELTKHIDELQIINHEMEAFSYSVSHDLRAPIRCINGYSNIILEEYGAGFDDEQKRLFGIILDNSKKMGTLVDDLLAFSRMGKRSLTKSRVDFPEMVQQVLADITTTNGTPRAQVQVGTLLNTDGDRSLLYQVYMNLISNAIKYSGKKEKPVIEIGSRQEGNEHVYYVKDNGSGFDMEHAHKLFGVFQRLHSNYEFEGTGVGLAIVQRIVTKHGGRVWAEGHPGEGATFYFSLPIPANA
ncbi:MAG: response regulator [Bacteroidetes bacterium]|nr:response regulator [Bacteroidota bacterium]